MTSQYRKKLNGWLSYAFASEVFVIVSLTLFLPICLEQFARDNGYLYPDRTERCVEAVSGAVSQESQRCVVKIGWVWIDTASFSLYVFSISVALQALTVISVGGIADHPPHRKKLLLAFGLSGAFSAIVFLALPSSSPVWFFAATLAVIANIGFGTSVVAMNAYLPSLAKESPEVVKALAELKAAEDTEGAERRYGEEGNASREHDNGNEDEISAQPLMQRTESVEVKTARTQYENEFSRATSRISSAGIALGYSAGIVLLIFAFILVTSMKGTTFSLRLAISLSGVWWAVFSIPAAIWLPGAGSPGVPDIDDDAIWTSREDVETTGKWSIRREIVAAWKRLAGMLRWTEIKKLRNTFKFLAAWFLLSDAFTTITSTAILFGKTALNMQASALALIGFIVPCAGIIGSLLWPRLQRRFGWSNLKVLIILLVLASAIPAYGCLGFLSIFENGFGGLTTQGEMFGLAVYFGLILGAFQGYARGFYAELLPPGEEARWYGLFSITDKSSSFIGPLIVGLISDMTGNIRYSFFFLLFMVWAAVPVLMSVDVERGRRDAQAYKYSAGNGLP